MTLFNVFLKWSCLTLSTNLAASVCLHAGQGWLHFHMKYWRLSVHTQNLDHFCTSVSQLLWWPHFLCKGYADSNTKARGSQQSSVTSNLFHPNLVNIYKSRFAIKLYRGLDGILFSHRLQVLNKMIYNDNWNLYLRCF